MMKTYYRIVKDKFCGYEVQSWRWWWPFWVECDGVNTHSTIKEAEKFSQFMANRKVVKYLGCIEETQ